MEEKSVFCWGFRQEWKESGGKQAVPDEARCIVVAFLWKTQRTTESVRFKAAIFTCSPFTPPLSHPVTPDPLPLCWQTALKSSEPVIDTSYLGERRVCPQRVNARLPHPQSRQTHMTLFDTLFPDSTLAWRQNQRGHLSHAIRAENKDDGVRGTKKSWGSEGCNERWLEVEAPANELQGAGEQTHPVRALYWRHW